MKKYILFALSILILTFCGCSSFSFETETTISPEEEQNTTLSVGFSNAESKIEEALTLEELEIWQNPYEKYRSSVMYDSLPEKKQSAYRAIEYAMTKSYKYIFFDTDMGMSTKEAADIVEYLAFDSPLLEQNLLQISYISTEFYDRVMSDGSTKQIMIHGPCVSVPNFTEELWSKKLLAIKEAEKIYSTLDIYGTQAERAESVYRYLAKNVEYIPYENDRGYYEGDLASFLYDAFINKKTHCDGFSNALALLFELAGLEQVEKVGDGHTWNCVKIDGNWYNCDATAGNFIPEESETEGAGLFFAFGDFMQDSRPYYYAKYPDCPKSLYMQPDAFIISDKDSNFYSSLYNGFVSHSKQWSLIVLDEFDYDSVKSTVRRLVNRTGVSVFIAYNTVIDDKTFIFVYRNGYLK